jgi:hypothetical protein
LFAAFLGMNPIQQLLGPHVLAQVGPTHAAFLTGRSFFPKLISGPFGHGLHLAFDLAAVSTFLAAVFSWLRGGGAAHHQRTLAAQAAEGLAAVGAMVSEEVGAGSDDGAEAEVSVLR